MESIFLPNTGPTWIPEGIGVNETVTIRTTVPKVVEKRIYSNGKVRLDVFVLEDGTIHVDPDAFEYILQEIGFLSKEENTDGN